jgi:hypothetical protein
MKTITRNENNMSVYLLADEVTITEANDINGRSYLELRNRSAGDLNIADLNAQNSTVHENVSDIPDDRVGGKYLFDGNEWSLNEKFLGSE